MVVSYAENKTGLCHFYLTASLTHRGINNIKKLLKGTVRLILKGTEDKFQVTLHAKKAILDLYSIFKSFVWSSMDKIFVFLTVYFYLRILCKSDIRIISNGEIIGINKFRVRKTTLSSTLLIKLTLSLLGYSWKPGYAGGGEFDPPPSKSHVLCPNITNDTSLESSCALLLESAKNLQICKNWIFYRKIHLYSKNLCKKKFVKKIKKFYIFEKPLTMSF